MDNVVAMLRVQEALGTGLAVTGSDTAISMPPTVSLRMVVRRVWDDALKSLQMEHVAAYITRPSISALDLHSVFAARKLVSVALTLCIVVCLVLASLGNAWHQARMELVLGTEDILVWVVSLGSAAQDIRGVETPLGIAVSLLAARLVVSTIHTWASAIYHEFPRGGTLFRRR